jgi:hypothetical protein
VSDTILDNGRLTGIRLAAARGVWLGIAVISLSVTIFALPIRYDQLYQISGSSLPAETSPELFRDALEAFNISVGFFAGYQTALESIVVVVSVTVALLIFWRNSNHWPALFISLWLVIFSTSSGSSTALADSQNFAAKWVSAMNELGWSALLPFVFFIFPDGRFVPRWTRWLGLTWLTIGVLIISSELLEVGPLQENETTPTPIVILWVSIWIIGIAAQFYRFTRVSTPIQRQQTKWVLFGMFGTVFTIVVILSLSIFFPLTGPNGHLGIIYEMLIASSIFSLGFLLIPLSIGVAILRYRLWDIDVIINRALVYGLLTAMLALTFFGTVAILEQVLRLLTAQDSPLVIVISTLLIAALFTPLRRRFQDGIDQRFFRRKYDAERTLARFATSARDEVDLDVLTAELVHIVDQTMLPKTVSLWLKEE